MRLHGLYILYATGLNPASIIFSVGCLHARRKNLDIHISVYVITDISIPVSDGSDLICTCNVY